MFPRLKLGGIIMKKRIITIGREYGSGGHVIGEKVAKSLGLKFYDKELIELVARQSGYAEKFIEHNAENRDNRTAAAMYSAFAHADYAIGMFSNFNVSSADQLFTMQSKLIMELAEKDSCVIVGRCADYILRKRVDVLNVFVHADIKIREQRAVEEYGIDVDHVKKEVSWQDKTRASHYKYYTESDWGLAKNYHISLDSELFGIDGCVSIITDIYKRG